MNTSHFSTEPQDELLAKAWLQCMAALSIAQGSAPDEDDEAMAFVSTGELLDWCDDLEARVGLNVHDFRKSILEYTTLRDGSEGEAA